MSSRLGATAPEGFTHLRRRAPRLLIADDDEILLMALSRQLHHSFDIVGCAHNADEAIEMSEALRPEVAVVDVQMPAGGGLEATCGIREHAPTTAIVALSSGASTPLVRAILQAGAMTYLRKGHNPREELTKILWSAIVAHATFLTEYGRIPQYSWTGEPCGASPFCRTASS